VRYPQLRVVFGRDEGWQATAQDQSIYQRDVGVALGDDALAQRGEREQQGVVSLRGPVGQKPRALGAVGFGGELLRFL
jgi:hypothetical protein